MNRMGWALRTLLVVDNSSCLKDRKVSDGTASWLSSCSHELTLPLFVSPQVSGKLIRKCAPGTELVDWLVNLAPIVHTRAQAAGMWQALLEEGVLTHGEWPMQFIATIAINAFNTVVNTLFLLSSSSLQSTRNNRSRINAFCIDFAWMRRAAHRQRAYHRLRISTRPTSTSGRHWVHSFSVDQMPYCAWYCASRKCNIVSSSSISWQARK